MIGGYLQLSNNSYIGSNCDTDLKQKCEWGLEHNSSGCLYNWAPFWLVVSSHLQHERLN